MCSTLNVIGADVSYNASTGIHSLSFANLYPEFNGGNKVLGSADGLTATWISVSDSYISDVAWSKITGRPTTLGGYGITDAAYLGRAIYTTAPLQGGGNFTQDRTLSITSVSATTSGVLPASGSIDGLIPQYSASSSSVVWKAGGANTVLLSNGTANAWGHISDGYISGVSWTKVSGTPIKAVVTYVATSNITLSGNQTIDGYSTVYGNRVLCVGQNNQLQNGIWIVVPSTWTRPTDFVSGSAAGGVQINVNLGTTYANTIWMCANQASVGGDVVDTNNLTFKQIAPLVPLVSNIYDGIAPKITAADRVLVSNGTGTSSLWSQIYGTYIATGTIAPNRLTTGAAGTVMSGNSDGNAWNTYATLGINTGSGTVGFLPKYTSATTFGNSVAADYGNGLLIGSAYHGSAFTALGQFKHLTLGTSYFDGTNYVTPGIGTNAIAEIVTDTSGIGFIVAASTGSGNRTDAPATFLAREKLRIAETGITVSGNVFATSTNNTTLTLQATGSTHAGFAIQAHAPTGTTGTLYTWESGNVLETLTSTGFHGFGTVLDPSACVDTPSLRLRAGAGANRIMTAFPDGTAFWSDSISGLTGITFSQSAVRPTITQTAATGTSPTSLTIEAQSATDDSWYTWSGDVRINAGTNSTEAKGNITFGYHDQPGTYATIGYDGSSIIGSLDVSTWISINASQVVERVAPYGTYQDVQWFQTTTTGTAAATFDITTLLGTTIPDNKTYTLEYTIQAAGDIHETVKYVATALKSGGTITLPGAAYALVSIGSVSTGMSCTNSRIRLTTSAVGAYYNTVTQWTVKVLIIAS